MALAYTTCLLGSVPEFEHSVLRFPHSQDAVLLVQLLGFLSNTGPDPLEIKKKYTRTLFIVGSSMAGRL